MGDVDRALTTHIRKRRCPGGLARLGAIALAACCPGMIGGGVPDKLLGIGCNRLLSYPKKWEVYALIGNKACFWVRHFLAD